MSETEGIPDIHPDVPPSRAVLFQHYQQILDLVDQALHALSGKNIESFDEIKNIEKLYKNAKALLLEMEQTPGRDLVANKLLRIYQLMEKARHNLSVAEYNEKSHFLMSLLHQAERALENNETDKALRMYMHMKDIFDHLPQTNTLDTEKYQNLQRHLQQIYQKVMFTKEIEQDVQVNKIMLRISSLIEHCQNSITEDKAFAEKLYQDILEVYEQFPGRLIEKKLHLQHQIQDLREQLDGTTPQAEMYQVSDELLGMLRTSDHLKSQQAFKDLMRGLADLYDHKETGNLDGARQSYEEARKAFFALDGEKDKIHKLMCKARDSLILLAEMGKVKQLQDKAEAQVQLAQVRRMSLDYNAQYPEDHKFTDRLYQECDEVGRILQ
ncbi:TPA: hypothetical protein HA249_06575 [Candidatus Woesearchaeota archaeon]|nr:hypothetical protein [Candidatus Woesearchaeota archaeon]HII88411.1 hypothetical protein [Candidatus Woesearchaeota archaeon]